MAVLEWLSGMGTRYVLARLLILSVAAMAIFAVSHLHGVSDPDQPHTLAERYLQQQTQGGFLTSSIPPLLPPLHGFIAPATWVPTSVGERLLHTSASRAPPQAFSAV